MDQLLLSSKIGVNPLNPFDPRSILFLILAYTSIEVNLILLNIMLMMREVLWTKRHAENF
jgi:hypothetical protein